MTKKEIDRSIINLLILTLITLSVWVGFEVYRAYTATAMPEVRQYLEPLNPTLDTQTLQRLEERPNP